MSREGAVDVRALNPLFARGHGGTSGQETLRTQVRSMSRDTRERDEETCEVSLAW